MFSEMKTKIFTGEIILDLFLNMSGRKEVGRGPAKPEWHTGHMGAHLSTLVFFFFFFNFHNESALY